MSKAVLISVQPKWCELIANGKKTIEVRKTKPKLETPFKVYIYCTKGSPYLNRHNSLFYLELKDTLGGKGCGLYTRLSGRVIGEFVCDNIKAFDVPYPAFQDRMDKTIIEKSCIRYYDLHRYAWHDCLFAWHISNLVIYDQPKELSEFYVEGDCDCLNCKNCAWFDRGNGHNVEDDCNLAYMGIAEHKSFKPITRPPQSWCYVEEVTK